MKLSGLFLSGALAREHFSGDKVFRVDITEKSDLTVLESLEGDFDTWKDARFIGDHSDVHIPARFVDAFEFLLKAKQMKYTTMIEDLETAVAENLEEWDFCIFLSLKKYTVSSIQYHLI